MDAGRSSSHSRSSPISRWKRRLGAALSSIASRSHCGMRGPASAAPAATNPRLEEVTPRGRISWGVGETGLLVPCQNPEALSSALPTAARSRTARGWARQVDAGRSTLCESPNACPDRQGSGPSPSRDRTGSQDSVKPSVGGNPLTLPLPSVEVHAVHKDGICG